MTGPDDDRLLRSIQDDPHRAAARAGANLADALARGDPSAAAAARRVLGLAAHAVHDTTTAAGHLRQAIRSARRAGDPTAEAECRMSYALVLDDRGAPKAALREIGRAVAGLSGLRRARAMMQQALLLRRVGRDRDALTGYQRALAAFRQHGDALWEGRALVNRGVLRGYHGELAAARDDLTRAGRIFEELALPDAVARVQHNLGFLAAQAGDVPGALAWYDRARDRLAYVGAAAVTQLDRAELLLAARLRPEARTAVREAIEAAQTGSMSSLLGQARLLSARVELDGGDPAAAGELARRARAGFRRQSRPTWAAVARRIELSARVAAGAGDRRALRDLESTGDRLGAANWLPAAWDAWIDTAHLALDLGDPATAGRCLTKAADGRRRGPAELRARAWHATARLALAAGEVPLAKRRLAAAYREIEQHRASLGATELGVRGGAAGVGIAEARLRLCLAEGDARAALTWLQRVRSVALRLPPARPPDDPVVEALLAELRTLSRESATTAIDSPRTQRLLRRQRAVEAEIRQRSWHRPGEPATARRPPSVAELAAALGDRALVEYTVVDGRLHALVVAAGRVRHRPLGAAAAAEEELAALRFAVRRQVVYPGTRVAAQAEAAISHAAGELDRLLLRPVADLIGDRPLVLVPTGHLHALPWSMLPGCHGRPVAVNPSSWQWWRAESEPAAGGGGPPVLVAGPAPLYARAEVEALAAELPAARVLTGAAATAAATLAALDGAALGHVACHGVFRADNPMFSHLLLADGPLTVCDLSALRRPPAVLVLSSCDAGLSAVHPGDELQGIAAALLGLGTRTVVASPGPVGDADTLRLMTALYRRRAAGRRPADALAEAQPRGGFVCLGAG
ncbi:CHAT domain-containing protein [Dactylosporangium sp. NPDC051541]|uniref:CHAT domain-containing protein n=1 Tax=Dactylosporangium sp. NPDC051541 TaxID=3363977 RepID=UPI0037BD9FAD